MNIFLAVIISEFGLNNSQSSVTVYDAWNSEHIDSTELFLMVMISNAMGYYPNKRVPFFLEQFVQNSSSYNIKMPISFSLHDHQRGWLPI